MEEISTDHMVLFTKTYICIIQHYYNRLQKLCSVFIRNWNLMVSTAHNFALNSFMCISQTLWNIKVHPGTLHDIFINKLIATNFVIVFSLWVKWTKETGKSNVDFCRQYLVDDVAMLLLHLKQLEIQSTTSIILNNWREHVLQRLSKYISFSKRISTSFSAKKFILDKQ